VRRLTVNVATNWANALVAALLAFLVTPYVIESLKDPVWGNQAYGVWTFIVSATAYLGLFDLGFFQGVIQFFTRYRTQGRTEDYNRVVSTALIALGAVGLVATVVAAGWAWIFPSTIDSSGLDDDVVRWAFFVSAVAVIVRVPMQVLGGVLVGCNRFEVFNGCAILGRVVAAVGILWLLARDLGLLAVALATAGGAIVELLAQAVAAFRVEPALRISPRLFDRRTLGETVDYGKWMFGSRLNDLYLANVDLLIVPLLFGSEAIAVYGLAVALVTHAQVGVQGYTFALTPAAIEADASGSPSALQEVFTTSSRIGLILSGLIALGALLWGESFIYEWLRDPSFLWEAELVSAATVLGIVAVDRVFLHGLAGPQQVLIGRRRVRELCLIKVAQGMLAVALGLGLGRTLGILAVPWAILAASLLGRAALTWRALRLVDMRLARFAREALTPAALTLAVAALAGLGIKAWSPLEGWWALGVQGGLFCSAAILATWRLGLRADERASLGRHLGVGRRGN
jgi:O-antigen/teichoic acid export membrane protein